MNPFWRAYFSNGLVQPPSTIWSCWHLIILSPDPVVTGRQLGQWTGLGSCTRETSNDQGTTSRTRSCSTNGGRRMAAIWWVLWGQFGNDQTTWQGILPKKNKKKLDEHQSLDPPTMMLFNEVAGNLSEFKTQMHTKRWRYRRRRTELQVLNRISRFRQNGPQKWLTKASKFLMIVFHRIHGTGKCSSMDGCFLFRTCW